MKTWLTAIAFTAVSLVLVFACFFAIAVIWEWHDVTYNPRRQGPFHVYEMPDGSKCYYRVHYRHASPYCIKERE